MISKWNNLNLSKKILESMNYFEKCELLNSNDVLLHRHSQHQVEILFKGILLKLLGVIGKAAYYAIRIEFQVRGSSHVNSIIWILNPPKLSNETIGTYIKFIDKVIHASLLLHEDDPSLYEYMKLYQVHKYSKSCRKLSYVGMDFVGFLQKEQLSLNP